MIGHPASPVVRRLARTAAALPLLLLLVAAPAHADVPEGWEVAPPVSGFQFLLVVFLLPLTLFVVITLLAWLPSVMSSQEYSPNQPWREESEWFGGPRKGLDDAGAEQPHALSSAEDDRGGASARW